MTAGPADRYVAGYESGMQEYLKLHTVDRCASFFTPHLRVGMSLLDAGCGPGSITVGLAPLVAPGGRLVAVDASEEEVEKTRRALDSIGSESAEVQVADVMDLPFADGSFDAVFSHAVLDYLADPPGAVEEFRRVLKPGGVLGLRSWAGSVIGPSNPLIQESFDLFGRAVAEYGADERGIGASLGKLLKDTGFERIFVRPSFERIRSRGEWGSFCHAFGAMSSAGGYVDLALSKGWIDEPKRAAIAEAWESFASDTSNCMAWSWVEAVGFKEVG